MLPGGNVRQAQYRHLFDVIVVDEQILALFAPFVSIVDPFGLVALILCGEHHVQFVHFGFRMRCLEVHTLLLSILVVPPDDTHLLSPAHVFVEVHSTGWDAFAALLVTRQVQPILGRPYLLLVVVEGNQGQFGLFGLVRH